MSSFPPSIIQEALHAMLISESGQPQSVTALVSDSRQMQPGSLFVCIRGEAFDGHQFAVPAVSNGAAAVLCEEIPPGLPPQTWVLQVPNSIEAFRRIVQAWRKSFHVPVVAVAGSVGKTTTKELVAAALQGRYSSVLKTEGSQNGFLGIAMTLARLRSTHKAVVVEIGIDEPGAMQQHLSIVDPDAAVVTAIAEEHMQNFRDLHQVADEEMLPLHFVGRKGGVVAINGDDAFISKYSEGGGYKTIRFHLCLPNEVMASLDAHGDTLCGVIRGTALELYGRGMHGAALPLPLAGRHNAANVLAAAAVALGLGLTAAEISHGLGMFIPPPQRSMLHVRHDGSVLIGDYYNASPASMRAALSLFAEAEQRYQVSGKRYACLGDMLELGGEEERYHRELAGLLLDARVEGVWLFGERMRWLADELKCREYSGTVQYGQDHSEIGKSLGAALRPGDTALIKGSRGMRLEKVWDQLK